MSPRPDLILVASNLTIATYLARWISVQEGTPKSMEVARQEVFHVHIKTLDVIVDFLSEKYPDLFPSA